MPINDGQLKKPFGFELDYVLFYTKIVMPIKYRISSKLENA